MVKRGQIPEEERQEQLEEHLSRTPISLRDKLKDLLGIVPKPPTVGQKPPSMSNESAPVKTSQKDEIEEDSEDNDSDKEPLTKEDAYIKLVSSLLSSTHTYGDYLGLK